MKNQVMKCLKRAFAIAMATSMLVGMGMVAGAATSEESARTGIVYQPGLTYSDYIGKDKVPATPAELNTGKGYLFAGWFKQKDGKYYPLATADEVQTGDNVVAKFIPAQLLSVKCQAQAGNSLGSPTTSLKVFTCLDSLNYSEVGFKVKTINLSDDGKTFVGKRTDTFVASTTVYRELKVTDDSGTTIYTAAQAFGDNIGATYFATAWIRNIAQKNYSNIVSVQPYLKTLDGTQVLGLEKYVHVEDAFETDDNCRWVNVPINVRDTQAVAAGVLKLAKTEGWACQGIECGRLFQEMDYADGTNSVKLVGNLSTMTEDRQTNTIYANVRFKVRANDITTGNTPYLFNVTEVDFANIKEQAFTATKFPVWDVAFSVMK